MKQQNKLDAVLARVKGNKRAQRIAAALACLVVFVTLWQLTLPAITLEWGKPQAEGITGDGGDPAGGRTPDRGDPL